MLDAGTVIVTGRSNDALRLEAAHRIGADHTIDVDAESAIERVAQITGGTMADVAVDLTDAAAPVGACLELVRQGGRVLWAGLKNKAPVSLISDLVPLKGLTVVGGAGSTPQSMRKSGDVLNSGGYPTKELIGEVFTLDTLDQAIALLARSDPTNDAIRVSLVHSHAIDMH